MRRTGSHSNNDIHEVLRQTNQNSVANNESIESMGPVAIVVNEHLQDYINHINDYQDSV